MSTKNGYIEHSCTHCGATCTVFGDEMGLPHSGCPEGAGLWFYEPVDLETPEQRVIGALKERVTLLEAAITFYIEASDWYAHGELGLGEEEIDRAKGRAHNLLHEVMGCPLPGEIDW